MFVTNFSESDCLQLQPSGGKKDFTLGGTMLMASAELLIILSLLTISREIRGKSWCKSDGVGRMRALIGPPLPETSERLDPRVAGYGDDQRRAAHILTNHCRDCGKCKLARMDPFTAVPPLRLATSRDEVGTA